MPRGQMLLPMRAIEDKSGTSTSQSSSPQQSSGVPYVPPLEPPSDASAHEGHAPVILASSIDHPALNIERDDVPLTA